MSKRVTSRQSRTSLLRSRTAVLAASVGATAVLGAGIASASTLDSAATSTTASVLQTQAAAQAKAAAKAEHATVKKAASWIDPVKKYTLSATFNQAGGMWAHKHSGQDFAVPLGTDVSAAHGGTVVKAGGNGAGDGPAYGNAIVIKHGNGTYSQYAHLSRIDVRIGQVVTTGQHIALSGNTGNSSGPHLHFEIRTTPNYGSAIDPVAFLHSKGVKV
ncbi:M23 family metallopeptidase [Streptomyces fagopyri]|uniref:Peptidoglycan DD-metalloendopeptidase family protein n=1 Tax=Streptomyces fagopyri TaxID=2662397 RepID=A0A5Q0LDJ8_9ACTN|nr:M23 family metallopeptidase [Streptomyces fagopyri]QFZ75001.1 peptidoglycan DD-metalloendopeptidase family protein [Streptomyces fagopyri]